MSVAALLPALPWLAPFAGLVRLADNRPNLSDVAPVEGTPLSVIIPARNESTTIETVVRSILASSYRPLELLVVDDRSTDDTAAIVERLAKTDARLRLLRGEPLPPGWYGKPWACAQGARAATGDILVFTDADTRHEPELLGRAVGALRLASADLVTVAPHQRCVTFWERVIMPQIWLLLGLRYHPRRVNRAQRERDVIANGQFILTTREAYEAIGTHAAVRHEVAEDLALAQTCLRHGRRLHFAFAERLMETRMYQDLGSLLEGWSKNVYLGGRRSFPNEPMLRALVPVMLIAALGFWLVPPVILLAGLLGADIGGLVPAATAAVGLSALFWGTLSFGMKIPVPYGLLYPLGTVMALFIVLRSTWRGQRRVEWRGRVYGSAGSGTTPG
ncbi:MAG TPA: glycosyltransferase family 2 protein [Gemmatimonadales bacterium]|nr:glycosyltransferase family 2 protein [Gemmatimonadales bacterium]